jgi:hypothetical protein
MNPNAKSDSLPAFQSYAAIEERERNMRRAAAMTRSEALRLGFITVEDLDDEEILRGRCKEVANVDHNGDPVAYRFPQGKAPALPQDLYEALAAEHKKRMNEKLRQISDRALETMVEVMDDKTAEPADRFKASQYLFERVVGKTPDKVAVTVEKAPWEEVFEGIAQSTRGQSRRLRGQEQPTIDAEVVDAADVQAVPYGHIQVPNMPGHQPQEAQDDTDSRGHTTSTADNMAMDSNGDSVGSDTSARSGGVPARPQQSQEVNDNVVPQPSGHTGGSTVGDSGDLVDPALGGGSVSHVLGQDDVSDIASSVCGTGTATRASDPVSNQQQQSANPRDLEDRPTVPQEHFAAPGTPDNPHILYRAPDYRNPRNTMSVAPNPYDYPDPQAQEQYEEPSVPLSQQLRDNRLLAAELAEKRKAAKDMRKGAADARKQAAPERSKAKSRRIVQRVMGLDAMEPIDIAATVIPVDDATQVVRFGARHGDRV